MEWFEFPSVPRGGGGAAGGGSFFHLSFRSGSRARGACAGGAYAYISRTEEYDGLERDDAVYSESGHMPSWVGDDVREYWDAADLFERANGRLYLSADFALPRDLTPDDQVSLAHAFAQLCADAVYVRWNGQDRCQPRLTIHYEQRFRARSTAQHDRGAALVDNAITESGGREMTLVWSIRNILRRLAGRAQVAHGLRKGVSQWLEAVLQTAAVCQMNDHARKCHKRQPRG